MRNLRVNVGCMAKNRLFSWGSLLGPIIAYLLNGSIPAGATVYDVHSVSTISPIQAERISSTELDTSQNGQGAHFRSIYIDVKLSSLFIGLTK